MKVFNDIILLVQRPPLGHLIGYAADVEGGLLWIGLAGQRALGGEEERPSRL